ncbi:hypothetical protein DM860_016874 [Cuscuta australis]|uniref:Glycosyltransferase family 92 protein n=1 Tax=Cuscuta australis TaxID=267555 RepID=A0A328DXE7_9ASTE|nr:hypothetical protein DM860_016874 [Cuscuta australis]
MAGKGTGVKSAYVVVWVLLSLLVLCQRYFYDASAPVFGVAPSRRAGFRASNIIKEYVAGDPPRAGPLVIPSAAAAASSLPAVSVLVPEWQVFVMAESFPLVVEEDDPYVCLFENGATSPAVFTGVLPSSVRALLVCDLPERSRRWKNIKQPVLTRSSALVNLTSDATDSQPLLLRWNYLVYDSLTTEDDVVLFVKGVNNRQGTNREPSEFRCMFFTAKDPTAAVRTEVTSAVQEVFRCKRPESLAAGEKQSIIVSLEILRPNPAIVPSVAFYSPPRHLAAPGGRKHTLCASTMVFNVAKNLKEWVLYHSRIRVEKFVLYHNNSEDELGEIVGSLVGQGFDISTYFWPWPKTQESGFSHGAIYANRSCSWMLYADVDEFFYSESWMGYEISLPLQSMLPVDAHVAQLSFPCFEFGPSGKKAHPPEGVTQGYNCRLRRDNRHKSAVLLEAVDRSLRNVIHHFIMMPGYRTEKHDNIVINHYKYQAWPEFRAKFRRRVSAYVMDWTKQVNPNSNDRAPGLGFQAVEPPDWPKMFCEVYDNGLKSLAQRWFVIESPDGFRLAWQS